ncbi:MAG: ferric reductase-like transmembrane domain-containing protein [Candidatus Nanopelagicales bacterium]
MTFHIDEHMFWYLSRASGIVGWVLITVAVIWGVVLSTGILRDRDRPGWVLDLHRMLGGLALAVLVVHVAALMFDPVVPFSVSDALVPFASAWKPWAVAFGIIGFYLLVLIELSSFARRKMNLRTWRVIHVSAWAVALLGAIHAGLGGTDVSNRVYRIAALSLIGLTCLAAVLRLLVARAPSSRKLRVHRRMDGQPPYVVTDPRAVDSEETDELLAELTTRPTTTVGHRSRYAEPGTRHPS